jgi:hypothetical protein
MKSQKANKINKIKYLGRTHNPKVFSPSDCRSSPQKVCFPLIFSNTLADKDLTGCRCRTVSWCAGFVPLSLKAIKRATCDGKPGSSGEGNC